MLMLIFLLLYTKNNMKFLLIIFLPLSIFSQHIISSGGNSPSTISGKSIAFTIGEPITTTSSGNNKIITQGFQQPIEMPDTATVVENAFSPNGDGNNDTWKFVKDNFNTRKYEIVIFSRWGNIVWDNKDDLTKTEWNGTNKNDKNVPDGTYFYSLTIDGKAIKNGNGFVEITR